MFRLFNRAAKNCSQAASRRRRVKSVRRGLGFEKLDERVVFSSTVSVPAVVSLNEGASYKVPISRSGDLSQPLTLNYSFMTATADSRDISRSSGYSSTVTLKPGVKTFTLSAIQAVDDKVDEYDEKFYLKISLANGSKATIANAWTEMTIKDNDAAPNVSITPLNSTRSENSGTAYYRINLDAPSEKTVSVGFEGKSLGTLKWGQDVYFAKDPHNTSGQVVIPRGQTYVDIPVGIKDDNIIEPGEVARVSLKTGMNVSGFGQVNADVTIQDNDIPTLIVEDAGSITEGNSPGAKAHFKVRVQEPMERSVVVKYWTAAGDANSSTDYVSKSGTLTFGGDPRFTVQPSQQTVSVALRADKVAESTAENFFLGIGPVDSKAANRLYLPRTYGRATIVDDDAAPRTQVGTPAPISATPTPENGFGMVLYRWAAASNAYRYEISLRKENSFFGEFYDTEDSFDFSGKPITKTSFSPIYTSWLDEGTYFWKVRAVASDGTTGAWSAEQRFVIPREYAAN